MIKGGIYLYPNTASHPNGKLRLLYECNPIAFICEQAGGEATNGVSRIMDLKPNKLHQRTPFYCGSIEMIKKLKSLMV
jgi:fructose-1,6-bisphosphatase I